MFVRIGDKKAVVKPAMVALVVAVIVGVVAVVMLRRTPSQHAPDFGYANPRTWRFEAHQGAEATASSSGQAADGTSAGTLDAGTGLTVRVTKAGPTPDSVYLRNAFNLDLNHERRPLRLTFEARAGEGAGGKNDPFPLTFTVRDNNTLLWSERILTQPEWKSYERKITLKQSSGLNLIMAIHLGEAIGTVQIRNVSVVEDNS